MVVSALAKGGLTFEQGDRMPFEGWGEGAHHEVGGDLCIHHQGYSLPMHAVVS